MKPRNSENEARFAYEGLDRTIHERARLSILTSLMTHPNGVSFTGLKKLCGLTDGNLARHLQVLDEEGMVRSAKQEEGGRPITTATITASGRRRYLEYLTALEEVVKDAAALRQHTLAANLRSNPDPLKTS